MNAIFELLSGRERKTLERLTAGFLVAAALFFILAVRVRSGYFDSRDDLASLRERGRLAEKAEADVKAEWQAWQEAQIDIESFRGKYFYDEKTVFQSLRTDLQRIFNQAGMDIPLISYRYSEMDKASIKKVVLTFNYSGTYANLKSFLAIVEGFPKFLAVEKIDFQRPEAGSGLLTLKLTLAGYYEN
jgi:Tfp pilus assembly protein PilO